MIRGPIREQGGNEEVRGVGEEMMNDDAGKDGVG